MAQPIKVGIAGQGRSGWGIHARLIEPLDELFKVVAVADRLTARQEEAAERFNCRTYGDLTSMLQDDEIELVVNSLPSYLHPSGSIEALQAGKHVVCEKPMAARVADADEMIAAARQADRVLAIFQNYRYDPDYQQVREVIASGKLGRIVQIRLAWQGFGRRWDWQTLQKYDGGSMNNTGPHPIDWALQLFGPGKPEVFCHLERTLTLGDAEDHVKIILQGPNAPLLDIEITSACAYPQDTWLVMGTQGTLAGTRRSFHWKYMDPTKLAPRQVDERPTPDRSYNREQIDWVEESWDRSEYTGPGHTGFYLDLYETIRNGKPLFITPESVRRQVEVLEACHRRYPRP
ncbi:MAG: Gfo/Idh/MocA family oxidoreductase [Anaerolineae bacterium]|nr:Gfo/Idh/MocA family oxidoreductase [Anaerolineae bacterium]